MDILPQHIALYLYPLAFASRFLKDYFERQSYRDTHLHTYTEIFRPLVYSPNSPNGQAWARLNPRALADPQKRGADTRGRVSWAGGAGSLQICAGSF